LNWGCAVCKRTLVALTMVHISSFFSLIDLLFVDVIGGIIVFVVPFYFQGFFGLSLFAYIHKILYHGSLRIEYVFDHYCLVQL
jgi:hypothetical protein